MSVLVEGALNRLTAAVLALGVTVERARLDRSDAETAESVTVTARENVRSRFERELEGILEAED